MSANITKMQIFDDMEFDLIITLTYVVMGNFHPCFPREGISFIGHNSGITGLALAGSNKLLSLADDGKLSVWDLATKIRLAIYLLIFLIMLVFWISQ